MNDISASFTVKNYRCFWDENPARFDVCNGIIAFVGPNNSGKSSILKFLREFRPLWTLLALGDSLPQAIIQGNFNSGVDFINDPLEIFCDHNERDLFIDICVDRSDSFSVGNRGPMDLVDIAGVEITAKRSQVGKWVIVPYAYDAYGAKVILNNIPSNLPFRAIVSNDQYLIRHKKILNLFEVLADSLYIGPFRNVIDSGGPDYYDLVIGGDFVNLWNSWKTGASKEQNRAVAKVSEDIKRIFEFDNLEILSSVDLNTLQLNVNDKPYKLSELGSGLSQFIVCFGNALIKRPSLLLIDEPELHLHPSLQIDFLISLSSYISCTIICATHSIGLARSAADYIYSVNKTKNGSVIKQFESTPSYTEFLGEMSFSSYRDMGFNQLLLVEGTTDVKTIQQFLRKVKIDHKVVVVPLGGDSMATGNVEHELMELKRLSSDIVVVVDSERISKDSKPAQRRLKFAELCKDLGFKVLLTERRAIENYFTDSAIKNVFGSKYSALLPYQKLEDAENPWSKSNNWKVAREMNFSDISNTDLGQFISEIKNI